MKSEIMSKNEKVSCELFAMGKGRMAVVCRTRYQDVGLRKFLKNHGVLYAVPHNEKGEEPYPLYYAIVPVVATKGIVFAPSKDAVELKALDWKVLEYGAFMKRMDRVLDD